MLEVVGWTLGFICFFFILKIRFSNRTTCNLATSGFHSAVVTFITGIAILWQPGQYGVSLTQIQKLALEIASGYYVYDTLYSLVDGDYLMAVHHLCTLSGLVTGLFYNISGFELCYCLFLTEPSTLLLNARYFLRSYTQPLALGLSAYDTTSLAFAVVFIMGRLVIGGVITTITCFNSTTPLFIKLCACGIVLVSAYWAIGIVNKVKKALSSILSPKKE
eukprot:Platyproteum_vivax@DN15033_c0_g1_i1.p1